MKNMEFYKHDQLFLLLCYYISRRDRQESIVISHLKSTAYSTGAQITLLRGNASVPHPLL